MAVLWVPSAVLAVVAVVVATIIPTVVLGGIAIPLSALGVQAMEVAGSALTVTAGAGSEGPLLAILILDSHSDIQSATLDMNTAAISLLFAG